MRGDHRVSLDGTWDFQINPDGTSDATPQGEWRSAIVPMPWQAQFEDLRNTSGVAWYRRYFVVDQDTIRAAAESAAILYFGAVDYQTTVWINGKLVGENEGGYLPFEFDIIDLLREGDNELLVKVVDATDNRDLYADYPFGEIPHGKQSWYGPISGIWQSVWLEFRPKLYLAQIRLDPSPRDGTIGVRVILRGTPQAGYQVHCAVSAADGQIVGSSVLEQTLAGLIRLERSPELWSPDAPNLYTVTATLQLDGNPIHAVKQTCGFRTIEAREGRIYLNADPIYLRGVLDQGYYPETIYTPNSLALLEAQARSAKALGFNCLRIHIKIEDPRYYEVADRIGLLVWAEIPSWALLTDASAKRARLTFEGMVQRDGHHPSIIAWTLINENWGTDLARNAEHRLWLMDFYHHAKSVDPTRLVIDNSACAGNAHVASDLEDFHNYRVIPDHADEWDDWIAEFAERRAPVWYPDYERERRTDLPLLVSEFGNWGLPDPDSIRENGKEPWWFETGSEWDNGIVYPHGVKHRYDACGLADLFRSYEEFARHAQEHMARSLHYEITSMRLQDTIAGYVVTEFTDVHWECNGLLTMQREPKYLLDPLLKDLNQDRVVVLRPMQWSGHPGEELDVLVQTVGIDGRQKDGKVVWQAGSQTGELPASGGKLSLLLDKPGVITLYTRWLADDGFQIATNQVNLVSVSMPPPSVRLRLVGTATLGKVLRDLGYQVSEGEAVDAALGDIIVAHCYTSALETHIQSGGRVLLLADPAQSDGAGITLPVGYIARREGTTWQGDWANSIGWLKKKGALAHIPGGPLLEMEWAAIMPGAVLAGLPTWIQCEHSWAGLTVGWLHKSVSLLTVLPYGRGQIIITTFKLDAATLATDAIAQALFGGMLGLL